MKLAWEKAPDVDQRLNYLVDKLELEWILKKRVFCFRSKRSSARAYARIWGFNQIWQLALSQEPAYVIEVLSEKYDRLSDRKKDSIIMHELAHIPKNFSGALVPHTRRKKGSFRDKLGQMEKAYKRLK